MSLSRAPTDKATLKRHHDILAREFDIQPARFEDARGGWSARAFMVESHGKRYFLKVYDSTKQAVLPWIERISHYIRVLGWLAKTAELQGRIVTPVPAPNGEYKVESGTDVYLLFDFVDGFTPGVLNREQLAELATILARLHGLGTESPVCLAGLEEDTSLWFCKQLNAFLDADDQSEPGDFLKPYKAALQAVSNITLRLRDSVRIGSVPCSLCHTDAHGNNVIQGDRLVLADWEGLCIAPAEADLFMYAGVPDWDAFIGAYYSARPGFVLNRDMLLYYQCRRYLEDIWYFLTRLKHDHPGEREAGEVYTRMRSIISLAEKLL